MPEEPVEQSGQTEYGLLYPFVACESKGGPYPDEAFVAGVSLGQIDKALEVAAAAGATEARFTARTALVRQLELCGMARGFPVFLAEQVDETDQWPAMPEWSFVTFRSTADA